MILHIFTCATLLCCFLHPIRSLLLDAWQQELRRNQGTRYRTERFLNFYYKKKDRILGGRNYIYNPLPWVLWPRHKNEVWMSMDHYFLSVLFSWLCIFSCLINNLLTFRNQNYRAQTVFLVLSCAFPVDHGSSFPSFCGKLWIRPPWRVARRFEQPWVSLYAHRSWMALPFDHGPDRLYFCSSW